GLWRQLLPRLRRQRGGGAVDRRALRARRRIQPSAGAGGRLRRPALRLRPGIPPLGRRVVRSYGTKVMVRTAQLASGPGGGFTGWHCRMALTALVAISR